MKQLITFAIILFSSALVAQKTSTIAFYNVENLFDTIDGTNDDAEFLPAAKSNWNTTKFNEKTTHVAQVINELEQPLIIGLCEIENASVVRNVLQNTNNKSFGLVHYESPDARGIDVALIYDSLRLKLAASGNIRFTLPGQTAPSTRDIVWGKFTTKKDVIYALVNHWPSRRSGQDESEILRITAAQNARHFIDSILTINKAAKIVLMGDLNDYPADKAPQLIQEKLTPMIVPASGKFGGTHNYKDEWHVMDHIFISNGFQGKKGMKCVPSSGKIYSFDYLLQTYKGQIVPFRTFGGSKYIGGYSDHLPVSISVTY